MMKNESKPESRNGLLAIPPYVPGSSYLPGFPDPVKLSSNENAAGCSPAAREAFERSITELYKYPDGGAKALREALAEKYDIHFDNIMCGAGSDNLLELAAHGFLNPGDESIYFKHSFVIYNIAVRAAGGVPVQAEQEPDLSLKIDRLIEAVTPKTKLIFIANPDNPTGTIIPFSELEQLIGLLPSHILIVIDEAYYEFADSPDYKTALPLAEKHNNVLVTRTFSKMFGLAALRVGWGYASSDIINIFARIRSPFNISVPGQKAATAALKDTAWQEENIQTVLSERARLEAAYTQYGYHFIPSQANFTLLPFENQEAASACEAFLLSQGIIIRNMTGNGLPHCLRISVGLPEQNDVLLAALEAYKSQ